MKIMPTAEDATRWELRVACLGAGYVGGPTMAVIAEQCPDVRVAVLDISAKTISRWNSHDLPIYEPGLEEIVMSRRGKNLFFSCDIDGELRQADIVFVAVNTPTKRAGLGAGCAAETANVQQCVRKIAEVAKEGVIVVEKSTVPVGTARALERILSTHPTDKQIQVLSNPEFLAEGTAIDDLRSPARVLIGGREDAPGRAAVDTLVDLYARWVPGERILTTNLWSAELSKLASNAFLAQRVSSINSLSLLCDKVGADVTEVSRAVGLDPRIGSRFLQASVGFGGSCFQKDLLSLVYICESEGLQEVADYWRQVLVINEHQRMCFGKTIMDRALGTVSGKRIAIFGFAFKKDTGDARESSAGSVVRRLLEEGAICAVYDPAVSRSTMLEELEHQGIRWDGDRLAPGRVISCGSCAEAAKGAHAIVIMTEWDEFKTQDYRAMYNDMAKPASIADGRGILMQAELREIGYSTYAIGSPDGLTS